MPIPSSAFAHRIQSEKDSVRGMTHTPSPLMTAVGFVSAAVKAKTLDEKKSLLLQRKGYLKPGTIIGQAFDQACVEAKREIAQASLNKEELASAPTRAEIRQAQREVKGFVPATWGGEANQETNFRKRAEHALWRCAKAADRGDYFLAVAHLKVAYTASQQGMVKFDLDHLSKSTRIPRDELLRRVVSPITEQDLIALRGDRF